MLIFIIPAIYPSSDTPQLGIYVKEHCQALKDYCGHSFVVLNASTQGFGNWKKCKETKVFCDSVGTVYQHYSKGLMQSRLPHFAVHEYRKNIRNLFEQALKNHGKPDLIYAHFSFPSGYVAMELSKEYGIPYVVDEHYSLYYAPNIHPYIAKITKETIENASRFICVSNPLRNALYRHTGLSKGIEVIPNLVNRRFQYSEGVKKENFVFFTAGNFFINKNFELLMDAFLDAFSPQDKVELRIAGDGELREILTRKIQSANRGSQIKMLGRLSSEAMLENYKYCDCFALLSNRETFGIVYREALAVGRPVIATRNGGIEEDWNDDYGILLSDKTVECASSALLSIYKNRAQYDSKKISEMCLARYSERAVASAVNSILIDAIDRQLEDKLHIGGIT